MKRLILTVTLSALGWSASYDPFLLDTQLSLLPKIAMLEKNLLFANAKSPINILIAYDRGDDAAAELCTKILMNKFNGTVNTHPMIITILPFDKLESSVSSYHFIYALKANVSQLKKVHNAVGSSGAVTALYEADKLGNNGLLLSVKMERTPVILINAKVLRENHFSFPDSLLEIARIIQ